MSADEFSWSRVPWGPGVRVCARHACGLAAVAKPADVLSHPNRASEAGRSLVQAAYDADEQVFRWKDEGGRERNLWLLHRLDSATSGVMLVAAGAATASAVRKAFESRSVQKTYVAIVLGHPRERRALWRDAMDVRREGGAVRAQAGAGGMRAETGMRCLRLLPGPPALAALELQPHTGRTHQLRHQCARRHLPILGDQNYGNFRMNRELARQMGTDRLFLHALRVVVDCTVAGQRVRFTAEDPLPREFSVLIGSSGRR